MKSAARIGIYKNNAYRAPCQYCGREFTMNQIDVHERTCDKNPDPREMKLITLHIPVPMLREFDDIVDAGKAPTRSEIIRHALACYLEFIKSALPERHIHPVNVASVQITHPGFTLCPKCNKLVSSRWGCKKCHDDQARNTLLDLAREDDGQ